MVFIDMREEVRSLVKTILDNPDVLYADIESTGLDWFTDKILLFQVRHKGIDYVIDIRGLGYEALNEFLAWTRTLKFVFHNLKFDLKFIYDKTGILLENCYDTMTSEAVLNSGKGKTFYSLEELAIKYAGIEMDKSVRLQFVNYPDDKPFTQAQINYSAIDTMALEPIYLAQMKQFEETRQTRVCDLEAGLLPYVAKMEYDGIRIDREEWIKIDRAVRKELEEKSLPFYNELIDFLVGYGFKNGLELVQKTYMVTKAKQTKKLKTALEAMTDIENMRGWILEHIMQSSTYQMTAIFNLMGIDCPNTNEKVLTDYRHHPIVEKLIELRGLAKKISQYGEDFLKAIHPKTGKIHTEYLTVGTQTGRFSSSNPNLQNVPTHGGYRECFLPDEDYFFAAVDYSQQEYRLAGAISREPVIIQAYKDGSDMHIATAKIVYKKNDINNDERKRGKTVNFAILYGSTEYGLHKNLRIDIDEATAIIKDFWEGYKNLKRFMDRAGEHIMTLGYSCTPLGRRRYNVEKPVFANSYEIKKWQEGVLREGKNHIIQGGGADIIKLAMLRMCRENPFGNLFKLTLQIHDEVVAQIHKSIKKEGLEFMARIMLEEEQKFLGEIPAKIDGYREEDLKERWSK